MLAQIIQNPKMEPNNNVISTATCTAFTKKKKRCRNQPEKGTTNGFCSVHQPAADHPSDDDAAASPAACDEATGTCKCFWDNCQSHHDDDWVGCEFCDKTSCTDCGLHTFDNGAEEDSDAFESHAMGQLWQPTTECRLPLLSHFAY